MSGGGESPCRPQSASRRLSPERPVRYDTRGAGLETDLLSHVERRGQAQFESLVRAALGDAWNALGGSADKAMDAYVAALETARRQRAPGHELRVALRLAQVWRPAGFGGSIHRNGDDPARYARRRRGDRDGVRKHLALGLRRSVARENAGRDVVRAHRALLAPRDREETGARLRQRGLHQ